MSINEEAFTTAKNRTISAFAEGGWDYMLNTLKGAPNEVIEEVIKKMCYFYAESLYKDKLIITTNSNNGLRNT